jgi:hypothetical protein
LNAFVGAKLALNRRPGKVNQERMLQAGRKKAAEYSAACTIIAQ